MMAVAVTGTIKIWSNTGALDISSLIANDGIRLNPSGTGNISITSGNLGIGTTCIPQKLIVNGNADSTTDVWVNNSDIRLKKNIESLPSYTDKLL